MSLKLVMSTDNWRPEWWGVEKCFARTRELGVKSVELTTATGYGPPKKTPPSLNPPPLPWDHEGSGRNES